jgi:hypothetical protein
MRADYEEDSGALRRSQGSDAKVGLSIYGLPYATRPNTCGRQGAHCLKAIAHNAALSRFRPRWIDAFRLTCHIGRPVTTC